MMKTIFFGASQFVIPLLEYTKKNTDLLFVITTEQQPTDALPAYCTKHNIAYITTTTLKDAAIIEKILYEKPTVGILAYFGLILPQSFIDLFPKGIINIHPSLLPKYRGTTPVQQALLSGDEITGVSIMLLDQQIDHGPILAQEQEKIEPDDTAVSLYTRLFKKGTKLLDTVLQPYMENKLIPTAQNHTQATFTKPLTRQSGFVDPMHPPAKEAIERMIKAYYPWPGVWTICVKHSLLEKKMIKFLPQQKIQVEGKKPLALKDFINGYPKIADWIHKFIL